MAEIDDDISALRTVLRESDWAFESHQYSTEWQYTASCDRISRIVAHIDAQAAEIERLKATAARADTQAAVLRTVERWANHHARKPKTTAEEALSVIQHHPAIRDITASYADGVVPDTPDPYAEIERLRDELALCCQLKREYQEQAK